MFLDVFLFFFQLLHQQGFPLLQGAHILWTSYMRLDMILTANSSLTSDDNTEEASGGEVGEDGTSIGGSPSGNEADSKSLLDLPWYGVSMEYTPMCDVSEHLSFEKPM